MSTPRNPLADFAPRLVEMTDKVMTDKVLFGDVWERPQLGSYEEGIRREK